jgi:hypothetical protein
MVEFFSSRKMQEGILMMMFKAASNSVEGRTAVNRRFRTADPLSLLSNLIKISRRHADSVAVFVGTFKIIGILSLMDAHEDSTARMDVILAHHFFSLIIEGAVLHKDNMNMLQCEALIKALTLAPGATIANIRVCIDYMQSFPESNNIASDTLCFISEHGCDDDEDVNTLMAGGDVLAIILQAITIHLSCHVVVRASCQVLGHFMDKDSSMLATFISENGIQILVNIVKRHNDVATLCAAFDLMQTIACDSAYVGLLHDHGIIEFVMTNTAVVDLFVTDASTVSQFMSMLLYCISNRRAFAEVLLSYDILSIIERSVARHPNNLRVYGDVVSLLVEMNTMVDLKTRPFTDGLLHIFGANFVRFINNAVMTQPVLHMFAIFAENVQNVHWPLIYNQYLDHVHQAMAIHKDHLGIQRAGGQVIMLMTPKKSSHTSSSNLVSIDRILVAAAVHKETHIYMLAMRVLTDLMVVPRFREHMIQKSALFLVLDILQSTVEVDLITFCLLFLSKLQRDDHNAHTTGKVLRSHSPEDRKKMLYNLKNVDVLVAKSLECCGATPQMRELAQGLHFVQIE